MPSKPHLNIGEPLDLAQFPKPICEFIQVRENDWGFSHKDNLSRGKLKSRENFYVFLDKIFLIQFKA